jgi:uncharacterized membrane protein YqiK
MSLGFWVLIGVGVLAVVVLIAGGMFRGLYVKVPANLAFVRTGFGGRKVVADAGAFVLPVVHNIQWLSLETAKIEILRRNRDAFITKDRYRVDIGAEFYLRIPTEGEMLEAASRSLGERSFSADGLMTLVEEKLVSALRSAAAERELVELHENRRGFALRVRDLVQEPLAHNGLVVEDVAVFSLDQTDKDQLDPNNIFDAEGLRQITAQTSARMRERNEIERTTEVEIKRKDVEAVRVKLELDREQSFAEAEQSRQIKSYQREQEAGAQRFSLEQEQQTREAEITKDRQVREAELARDVYLFERERDRETAEIEGEQGIEKARRAKDIVIIQEERRRIAEEEARLRAEAERVAADEAVITAAQTAGAEREKEIALIRALHEVEVADRKARATERLAEAKLHDGQAEAQVAELMRQAENATDPKVIYREVALRLVEQMPEIARELMEPARHIDSIRVLDVAGFGGGGTNGGTSTDGDAVRKVFEALLGTGAALPLLKELLSFAGSSGLSEKLEDALPGAGRVLRSVGGTTSESGKT